MRLVWDFWVAPQNWTETRKQLGLLEIYNLVERKIYAIIS